MTLPRVLLLLLLCVVGVLPLRAASWVRHEVAGVSLYVHDGQEALARRVGALLEEEVPRVAATLGLADVRDFPVYAYDDHVEFMRDTGVRPHLLGQSTYPVGVIRLVTTDSSMPLRVLLAHELTHTLLAQRLGPHVGTLPIWVNEGIAGHLSDPVSPAQLPQVSRLIHRDGVLTLDELRTAFTIGPHRDAAYLQSRSMIAWLEHHFRNAIPRLLNEINDGQSFAGALQEVTGLTLDDWWYNWQQSVPVSLYWLTFVFSSPVVFAPLALLLIWAAIRRIRQKTGEDVEESDEDDASDDEDDPSDDEHDRHAGGENDPPADHPPGRSEMLLAAAC